MRAYRPFTERVLDRLPGPRWAWIFGWAFLAPATYLIGHVADPAAPYPGDLFVVTFAWVGVLGLWGAGIVVHGLDELDPSLTQILPAGAVFESIFRPVGSTAGPLVMTLVVTVAFEGADFLTMPGPVTGLRIAPVFVGQLSVMAYIWVLLALLIGVDRLGRNPLVPPRAWTGLGHKLKPVGRLAFIALAIALVGALPVMVATLADLRAMIATLALIFASVSLLFLSVYRLHRQLAAAKARFAEWARSLYGIAVAPLEASPDGEALSRQAASLAAAAELERKADTLSEWPFDDWIFRTLAAVLIGATAGVIARAVGIGLSLS